MKVYLSVDIEGVAGIAHWDEARKQNPDYDQFQDQMNREAAAACRGALAAGASEILVKDAHATGRNLRHHELPRPARLIRGWSGHPLLMLQELDASFDAVCLVGWHSPASSGGTPLAHTYSGRVAEVRLDGELASEYLLHARVAASLGVPVVFVAGDQALTEHVHRHVPATTTVATNTGRGPSVIAEHPDVVVERIEQGVAAALAGDLASCLPAVPPTSVLELRYKIAEDAYRAAQYPGMAQLDDVTVRLEVEDPLDVLRAVRFVV